MSADVAHCANGDSEQQRIAVPCTAQGIQKELHGAHACLHEEGNIKPDGLRLPPLSCLRNCNRMDAADPPQQRVQTNGRTSDGRTRSRCQRTND
jgi:hypothetical protein